jgi:hypothetical protein
MYSETEAHNFWPCTSTAQLWYNDTCNWPSTNGKSENVPAIVNINLVTERISKSQSIMGKKNF